MRITTLSLNFYRKTVKRFRPAHKAAHWLMSHTVIPLLQTTTQFRTIPDDPFWFRLELLTGQHEPETAVQLDRIVQPGMVMLDVGAHVGYYSRRYAKTIGPNGRIFAFEPHPRTFATLQKNIASCHNVTAVQMALAENPGTAVLHDYLMMSASGSLHYDEDLAQQQQAQVHQTDIAPRIGQAFQPQTFSVQTLPGDSFLQQQGIEQVDVIKMDIEGAEIGALRGLRQTIARSPKLQLVMEYNPAALKAFGHDPSQALAEVQALGFGQLHAIAPDGSLEQLVPGSTAVAELTQRLLSQLAVVNLLFSRQ